MTSSQSDWAACDQDVNLWTRADNDIRSGRYAHLRQAKPRLPQPRRRLRARGMSVRVAVCGGSPSSFVRRTSAAEPVTRDAVILDGLE